MHMLTLVIRHTMIPAVLLAAATANTCLYSQQGNYYYCTDNSDIETPQQVNGETLCAPYNPSYGCCIASFNTTNLDFVFRRCYADGSMGGVCDVGSILIENAGIGYIDYWTQCDGNQDASLTPATTSTTTATTTVVSPAANTGPSSGAVVGIVVGGILGPFFLGGIYAYFSPVG